MAILPTPTPEYNGTTLSLNDEELYWGFTAIQLNFLVVGALFAAVVVLGFINIIIYCIDEKRKGAADSGMASLGDNSRVTRSLGGRGKGNTRATLLF